MKRYFHIFWRKNNVDYSLPHINPRAIQSVTWTFWLHVPSARGCKDKRRTPRTNNTCLVFHFYAPTMVGGEKKFVLHFTPKGYNVLCTSSMKFKKDNVLSASKLYSGILRHSFIRGQGHTLMAKNRDGINLSLYSSNSQANKNLMKQILPTIVNEISH